MPCLIEMNKLSFDYEGVPVLRDLDLAIETGSRTAIVGHNGSGKSTLAKHMNAILLPSGGVCLVGGVDTRLSERLLEIRQRVGMVFQNPDNQIVATVVEEDVAFALENLGVHPVEMRRRVEEAMHTLGIWELREKSPHQLSGGQKQRVAIAGVIAMRPECIVLDEPTAMLDPAGRDEVMQSIERLNQVFGITVVLITHSMEEAAACQRMIVLADGEILLDGPPREVFAHDAVLRRAGLVLPQATQFARALARAGVTLPGQGSVLGEEDCVAALVELFKREGVTACRP